MALDIIENKDLKAYLDLRIKLLEKSINDVIRIKDKRKRGTSYKQILGRILEIKLLKNVINQSKLKVISKDMWRKLNVK